MEMRNDHGARRARQPVLATRRSVTRRTVMGGIVAAALLPVTAGQAAPPLVPRIPPPPIRFDVIRAGSIIGVHEVDFRSAADGGYAVKTHIDIAVRLLGVTVFVFQHDSTETWAGGRLRAFDSETQDDDSKFVVVGRATADGFHITHRKGTEDAPADIMVGSYWTPEIARQTLLIDPQRGRLKQQQMLGKDTLAVRVAGRPVETTRFRLEGMTNGWVAYDAAGRWLAAELKKKGSDILYQLRG